MLKEVDDLWIFDEPPIDVPSELLTIPEIRQHLVREHASDEVGLRALLERPEALSAAWWRQASENKRRKRSAKRHPVLPNAA